jgi:hypothetical protein
MMPSRPTRPPRPTLSHDSELERYKPDEFVYVDKDGTRQRKSYPQRAFHLPPGRTRPGEIASYYTPEVLTQCVVKYSLKELLKDKNRRRHS